MTTFERFILYGTSVSATVIVFMLFALADEVRNLKQTYHGMIQENVIDTHNRDMRLMNEKINRFAPVEATMGTMTSSESIGILPTRIEAGQ